jgi:hypothetical protein
LHLEVNLLILKGNNIAHFEEDESQRVLIKVFVGLLAVLLEILLNGHELLLDQPIQNGLPLIADELEQLIILKLHLVLPHSGEGSLQVAGLLIQLKCLA